MNELIKVFWGEVLVFIVFVVVIAVPVLNEAIMSLSFLLTTGTILTLLGILLTWKTHRKPEKKSIDGFLLVSGWSGLGILPAIILHNLIYASLVLIFGEGVGDEPVFLLIGIVVLPITFIVGVTGVIYNLLKEKHEEN